MNDLVGPKNNRWLETENQKNERFSDGGLYIKEDDKDWGSAGMNDIQNDIHKVHK